MKTLGVFVLVLFSALSWGQEQQKVRDRSKDNFEELETGRMTLRFLNALTGKPVPGAEVTVAGADPLTTDFEGKVVLAPPGEDGTYPVSVRAEGFIPSDFNIEVETGALYFNRFSLSPILDLRSLRVVLDWGNAPQDLDLHFVKDGGYHISYRDMSTAEDGAARLDRDDTDGYGPETITAREVGRDARYTCFVHDYSNRRRSDSAELAQSKATIKVYGQGKLLNVFEVPRGRPGIRWDVFTIHGGVIGEVGSLHQD